ncbi:MAG: glycoside hydrolase family 2 [Pseudomonadales bacterium]|jgi:beta-galactosidase/beta-glucuronidase|nr:glycoside hydrolase family 2 [Pseudomonadales bacterium]
MNPIPRSEYPRPQLRRAEWRCLNGLWSVRGDDRREGLLKGWHRAGLGPEALSIIVPFTPEAPASQAEALRGLPCLWYEREFDAPPWGGPIMLHLGAADHWTRVFLNGEEVGQHRGGYAPFSFEISHALRPGRNRLTVRVEDSPSWSQPRGKQAGTTRWPIDYDPVTGIWQSVWLEPVPPSSVSWLYPRYAVKDQTLVLAAGFSRQLQGRLSVTLLHNEVVVAEHTVGVDQRAEARLSFAIPDPQLWAPEHPTLYDVRVVLEDELDGQVDRVEGYIGLRELSWDRDGLHLNGEALFLRGVLDQGYFPEGWYTAPSDEALRRDVELTLALGFNCARKHQKAEDPRYLYWADRLGLLVWAEMPSGRIFSTELVETLTQEWMSLLKRDRAHPSLVTWVPFNESWGVWHQGDRPEQRAWVDSIVKLTKALDPSRPVVGNDGWEYSSGDFWTLHLYEEDRPLEDRLAALRQAPESTVTSDWGGAPGRARRGALPGAEVSMLPMLLTECGGIGFGDAGGGAFAYGDIPETEHAFQRRIEQTLGEIAASPSLAGYVWTQLTDVQQEINGLLTFDRQPKLALETLRALFSQAGPRP